MKASVVRPGELGEPELARWRELQAAAPQLRNPFLAPGYALALDRLRDDVRVAVLTDAGETIGFFAFEQRGRSTAKPLGFGLTDAEGVVHDGTAPPPARAMLRAAGLDGWDFDTLIEEQVPPGADAVALRPSPVMDITGGYEAYLANRRAASKTLVQRTQRKRRKLEREIGELRFVYDERDPTALADVMKWKSGQYADMGEWDRFADRRVVDLVHDLHARTDPDCTGLLSVLYVGDKPGAAHFGLASSATLATWFPTYDPDLSAYSPGILLHFLMAEGAAERGLVELNLGRGEHEYKAQLKTGDLQVARGSVDASSVAPRSLVRRASRVPRKYLRPWLAKHPELEKAIAVRLSRRKMGS
jgi:CelD/BcsL family acetyltransferase involved in cellulose biosynthesis